MKLPASLVSLALATLTPGTVVFAATDAWRLTRDIEPLAQAVELTLDPAKDGYDGRVRAQLVVHRESTSFNLHALGPVISSAHVIDAIGERHPLAVEVIDPKHGFVTLTAAKPIRIGHYAFEAEFSNTYPRDGLGLYKTVSRDTPYLFTQFESHFARRAFPCWDEPGFKIPWQLTLTVPRQLEVVSNAAPAQVEEVGDLKVVRFGRTPPMPSYLVALAVGPFEYAAVPGMSVPGRIITPRGQTRLSAEAIRVGPAILNKLEQYFGVPYPYAKLDQIAVPEFVFGAMENAGLVTYRDTLLLMEPDRAPFGARRSLANITAHEMAHMWFGNLVTMAWWDDLWLNESFADWMCAKIIGETHPEYRIEIAQLSDIHGAMRSDALPSVKPIRRPLGGRDDPIQVVDNLTYNKGKAILRMVESWIGPAKFRAAMQDYFQRHAWRNTTATDLWAAFGRSSGEDITALLAPYIEQPGIPFVSFETIAGDRLKITQRRFTALESTATAGRWQVPLVVQWSQRGHIQELRVLLKEDSTTVHIPGLEAAEWFHPNAGEAGYYRWTLPPALNGRLARAAPGLSTLERLGLVENASALFSGGLLGAEELLEWVVAFANDPEPEVVSKVTAEVGSVRRLVGRAKRPQAQQFVYNLLRPALARLGVKPRADEPMHLAPLRGTLLRQLGASPVADDELIRTARELTNDFFERPTSVDVSLAGAALHVAIYHGDATLFERVQQGIAKAETPAIRALFIGALGGFRNHELLNRALAYSLTDKLNSTEFLRVARGAPGDPESQDLVRDWVMAQFEAIKAKASPLATAGLISFAGEDDRDKFEQLRAFLLHPSRTSQLAETNVIKAADRVALRAALREKEGPKAEAFIAKYRGPLQDR